MNILIVDDEMIAIQGIKASVNFEMYGIRNVYTANSLKQAQSIIESYAVDIMLCDIEMPNGSGLELIEWAKIRNPELVCIILTCHSDFEFAQQAVSLSCQQYLLKPATPDVLHPALERAIKQVKKQESESNIKKIGSEYVHKLTGDEQTSESAVKKVCRYIADHVSDEIIVEELAQMVYLSQNHLTRCFKKEYGKTVVEYITDYRIELAKQLLRDTDLTVTNVSAKVGYPNYAYFTKLFKKCTGQTPSKYKSMYGRRE